MTPSKPLSAVDKMISTRRNHPSISPGSKPSQIRFEEGLSRAEDSTIAQRRASSQQEPYSAPKRYYEEVDAFDGASQSSPKRPCLQQLCVQTLQDANVKYSQILDDIRKQQEEIGQKIGKYERLILKNEEAIAFLCGSD